MTRPIAQKKNVRVRRSVRLGFVPLVDCAPIVVAHELGLSLTPAREKRPHELSGGMRQRVSVARVGDILEVKFPRPRNRKDVMEHPDYYRLREHLITFLEDHAHKKTDANKPESETPPSNHPTDSTFFEPTPVPQPTTAASIELEAAAKLARPQSV